MRTTFCTFLFIFFLLLFSASQEKVYGASEEIEGKTIWEKLQIKQLECKSLTDDNFEVLGEYFMGKIVGSSHEVMNNMMVRMIGDEGEKQMYIAMGKRNSGCDTSAAFPSQGIFMPMMWVMGSANSPQVGGGANSMMDFGNVMGWNGFGFLGFLTWLFWVVVLVDLILLGIWIWKKIKKEK